MIFCINVDIDEVLLLDKNKDLGVNYPHAQSCGGDIGFVLYISMYIRLYLCTYLHTYVRMFTFCYRSRVFIY